MLNKLFNFIKIVNIGSVREIVEIMWLFFKNFIK